MSALIDRLRRALTSRRFPWVLGVIAIAVHLPGIGTGYLVDDHTHRLFARGTTFPGGPRGPWDLYRFADGGQGVREDMGNGLFPWWTNPRLTLAFFRPVTSLLRALEERLFGDLAVLCHVISILLFIATTLAVLALLRQWIGGAAASLGALLFAVDDAHATTVTWIAARHSVLGTLFTVLALTAFLRAKESRRVSLGSGLLFFLGLASSESALSGLAFFGAIALLDDLRAVRDRIRALLPIAVATLAWAGCYARLGYGAQGSAYYIDPLRSPLRFLGAAVLRAPVLALAQLLGPPAEVSGLAPAAAPALAIFGAVSFVAFAWLSIRCLPKRARTIALLTAFAVSLVPACGTNSDDRLLMLPGVAALALLACWARRAAQPHPGLLLRIATFAGGAIHVVLAALLLPVRALTMGTMLSGIVARGSASLPEGAQIDQQTLVLFSVPDTLLVTSMVVKRQLEGGHVPKRLRLLGTSPATPLFVSRISASVLELRAEGGLMHDPFVGAVRSDMFRAGEICELPGVKIEVVAVREGGFPTVLRFSFTEGSLDEGTSRFATWQDHRFAEVNVPAVGSTIELPALDFAKELAFRP